MGYALDYQTVSSTFIGYNEFGYRQFDTERTELGELMYRLKYNRDNAAVPKIVGAAANFIREDWKPPISLMIPVPPSQNRIEQPVSLLSRALSETLGIPLVANAVTKIKATPQLKNVYDYAKKTEILEGAFKVTPGRINTRSVLLFDDVYQSGATMMTVAESLVAATESIEIYTFSITKTHKR